jgi:hypothetical protein
MCTMLYEYNALSDVELSCELYWIVESRESCSANETEKSKGTYFFDGDGRSSRRIEVASKTAYMAN